jgi:hypothetical protein
VELCIARSTVTVTLALLALGCGGGHPLHTDGGAGAGGAPGTGGAPGAGGAPGGQILLTVGCQLDFTPCGGDVVGTWRSDPKCKPRLPTQAPTGCPGQTYDPGGVTTTVSWTFAADQTFTANISSQGTETVTSPPECLLDANGAEVPCDASAGATIGIFVTGGAPGPATCVPAAGACECAIPIFPAPVALSGTYTVTATTLTLTLPGGLLSIPADYCVSGNTLDLAGQSPLLPSGDFLRQ